MPGSASWRRPTRPSPSAPRSARTVATVLRTAEVQKRLESQGVVTVVNAPQEFDALIRSDTERFGRMLRDGGRRRQLGPPPRRATLPVRGTEVPEQPWSETARTPLRMRERPTPSLFRSRRGSACPITRLIEGERAAAARVPPRRPCRARSPRSASGSTQAVEIDDLAVVGLAHPHIVDRRRIVPSAAISASALSHGRDPFRRRLAARGSSGGCSGSIWVSTSTSGPSSSRIASSSPSRCRGRRRATASRRLRDRARWRAVPRCHAR